jgi:hypothetical protein
MALAEDTVAGVELQLFELDYKLTVRARAANTRILSENTIDLPLESMVVGGAYNDITHRIELTLQNGNIVSFPVDELVNGLISSSEKGVPNGVASLDAEGKVPKEQLPDGIGGGGASEEAIEEAIAKVHRTYTARPDYGFTVATLKSIIQDFYNGAVVHLTASGDVIRFDVEYAGNGQVTASMHTYDDANDVYKVNMLQYRYSIGDGDATVILPTGTLKTLVSDTDYPDPKTLTKGVIGIDLYYGFTIGQAGSAGILIPLWASNAEIDSKSEHRFINPSNFVYAFTKTLTNGSTTFTDEEKAAACETIGAVKSNATKKVLYGNNSSGVQQDIVWSEESNAYSIARRTNKGGLRVFLDETNDNPEEMATPRGYVDGIKAELLARIEALENK